MSYFNRAYSLVIGETGELGVAFDTEPSEIDNNPKPLHITFKIEKSDKVGEKIKAKFVIYNMSDASISKIAKDEKVTFKAGYINDTIKTLFVGQIANISTVNEGATVKTTIDCIDGYKPLRESFTSSSFKGGSTVKKVLTRIITKDLGFPTPTFNNGKLGDSEGINKVYQTGSAKIGASASVVSAICQENFLTWVIRDGAVSVYPIDGSTNVVVPLISAETGMIGSPSKSLENKSKLKKSKELKITFKVKVLLDGSYNTGDLVKIDSEFTNGSYRISEVSHNGSYEGKDWFTTLVLLDGVR